MAKAYRQVCGYLQRPKWRAVLGGNVQVIISGGAALQPRIARVLGVAHIKTIEGYGLTETSPVIAVSNLVTNEKQYKCSESKYNKATGKSSGCDFLIFSNNKALDSDINEILQDNIMDVLA